ncbi:MAG TPA: hypothetical protein PLC65_02645 [Bacteroidia bacterium]|nr:hypothetical protein [Bacteroidia bacterium]HRD37508.1 hypothetical protein [Bacteroidia bacterium]
METKKIYELHEEHKEWLNNLAFYKDEIKVMQNRISEVASKNSSADVLKQIEHFQNQLIIQRNNIDELCHSINDHENYLENRVNENPTAVDHRKVNDHPKMRDSYSSFDKVFNELRKELNTFLTKWM